MRSSGVSGLVMTCTLPNKSASEAAVDMHTRTQTERVIQRERDGRRQTRVRCLDMLLAIVNPERGFVESCQVYDLDGDKWHRWRGSRKMEREMDFYRYQHHHYGGKVSKSGGRRVFLYVTKRPRALFLNDIIQPCQTARCCHYYSAKWACPRTILSSSLPSDPAPAPD